MQGIRMIALKMLGIALVALLTWPQLASAQARHVPAPHPHRIGSPERAPVEGQAKVQTHASSAAASGASPWTRLTNQPTFLDAVNCAGAANPILLTDGTVMVQEGGCQRWFRLTPDSTGSYVNGTWAPAASLASLGLLGSPPVPYSPLYHSSAVLPDGRLIIEGGEYNSFNAVWTNLGAIYDPVANTWTSVAPPPFFEGGPPTQTVGDAQSVVLPNGTYMQANCCTNEAALLDAKTLTWTPTGAGKFDPNDEEGWTLLPNGKVLTVDVYVPIPPFPYIPDGRNYELYDPQTGQFHVAGTTPVQLWDSWLTCGEVSQEPKNGPTFEVGPAVLRPDGTVFYTGSNTCPNEAGHTAIYNSRSGKWKAGPDFPPTINIADGPASLEPNGKVLMMASPGFGNPPSSFFEWDGKSLTEVPGTPNAPGDGSYYGNMLILPTGQILLTDFSDDIEIYNPTPTKSNHGDDNKNGGQPLVLSAPLFVAPGNSYEVSGIGLNGLSQGAAYGDDVQAATNYPLVRITNLITGHVQYSRTHDHSSMAVASNDKVSTHFDVPANQELGISKLEVVANGIASKPVFVFVGK